MGRRCLLKAAMWTFVRGKMPAVVVNADRSVAKKRKTEFLGDECK
jgi:hypothetical protein